MVSDANPSNDMLAPATDGFEALSNLGFSSVPVMEWRAPRYPYESGEQAEDCIWRAFDVTSDIASQDALLWCSLAYEMPVKPKAPVVSYLADFERGVLLHIYDDRGMDVSALTASALMPVYRAFDPWLLDYDRDRMKTAFVGA